eukprot:ANDGO_04022.mRNA.1 hypothetical protein
MTDFDLVMFLDQSFPTHSRHDLPPLREMHFADGPLRCEWKDGVLRVFRPTDLTLNPTLVVAVNVESEPKNVSLSPDGSLLATSGKDGKLYVIKTANGSVLACFGLTVLAQIQKTSAIVIPNTESSIVKFAPDGIHVVVSNRMLGTLLWNLQTEDCVKQWTDVFADDVFFNEDGSRLGVQYFAVAAEECRLSLYDTVTGEQLAEWSESDPTIGGHGISASIMPLSLAWSKDLSYVACLYHKRDKEKIKIVDLAHQKVLRWLPSQHVPEVVRKMCFSSKDILITLTDELHPTASGDNSAILDVLRVWNVRSGHCDRRQPLFGVPDRGLENAICCSQDGSHVIWVSKLAEEFVIVDWDLKAHGVWRILRLRDELKEHVQTLNISKNGQTIAATCAGENRIYVWNIGKPMSPTAAMDASNCMSVIDDHMLYVRNDSVHVYELPRGNDLAVPMTELTRQYLLMDRRFAGKSNHH